MSLHTSCADRFYIVMYTCMHTYTTVCCMYVCINDIRTCMHGCEKYVGVYLLLHLRHIRNNHIFMHVCMYASCMYAGRQEWRIVYGRSGCMRFQPMVAVAASSYLVLVGLLVRGMVQEDLHRPKMAPSNSKVVESRPAILSETQPYTLSECSCRDDNNHSDR